MIRLVRKSSVGGSTVPRLIWGFSSTASFLLFFHFLVLVCGGESGLDDVSGFFFLLRKRFMIGTHPSAGACQRGLKGKAKDTRLAIDQERLVFTTSWSDQASGLSVTVSQSMRGQTEGDWAEYSKQRSIAGYGRKCRCKRADCTIINADSRRGASCVLTMMVVMM